MIFNYACSGSCKDSKTCTHINGVIQDSACPSTGHINDIIFNTGDSSIDKMEKTVLTFFIKSIAHHGSFDDIQSDGSETYLQFANLQTSVFSAVNFFGYGDHTYITFKLNSTVLESKINAFDVLNFINDLTNRLNLKTAKIVNNVIHTDKKLTL